MNVLFLVKHKEPGGLVKHTELLAKGLMKYESDKAVIGISNGAGADALKAENLNVTCIPFDSKNPLQLFKNYKQISRLIKENQIEMIHAMNRIPALYAWVYCALHKNVKFVWANHQVPIPSNLLFRLTTKYGYCAVAEGLAGKRMLVKDLRIPESKVRVVNLGIELDKFQKIPDAEQNELRQSLHIKEGVKILMLYGRLAASKGHMFLLEALSKIEDRNFVLILPGAYCTFKDEVVAKAEEYGISKNLIFPGFVNGRSYLSICDLVLLPSKNEGFPQACIEGYSMGVPVIRTKTGGYEDTADMCWGVDYGDVDGFAKLLKNFFDNEQIYIDKAEKAKELVKRLSIENMASEYQAIYNEAVAK